MKTFKIKVEGTADVVKAFTASVPDKAIVTMSGLYPSHEAPEVHRFMTLESAYYEEVSDLLDKLKNVAKEMEVAK